jgi:hypothetical protein
MKSKIFYLKLMVKKSKLSIKKILNNLEHYSILDVRPVDVLVAQLDRAMPF